jgi:hypothetical protein
MLSRSCAFSASSRCETTAPLLPLIAAVLRAVWLKQCSQHSLTADTHCCASRKVSAAR